MTYSEHEEVSCADCDHQPCGSQVDSKEHWILVDNDVTKQIEEDKLAFIDATNNTIDDLVEPIIEERMKVYSKRFGAFSRADMRLWDSCRIAFVVSYQSSLVMDEDITCEIRYPIDEIWDEADAYISIEASADEKSL